jgi:two-component system sensor histidine kinase KdpD
MGNALCIANTERFFNCEKLCKKFEATFIRVTNTNIAKAIADLAEKYRLTQLVMGKSQ